MAPATTGDGWGPAWQPVSVPDFGDERFDVLSAPPPEDPTDWKVVPTAGLHYRSPTEQEIDDSGWWTSHDLLVIPDETALVALESGSSAPVVLSLPLADEAQSRPQTDLELVTSTLGLVASHADVPFIELRQEGSNLVRHSLAPTFHVYLSTDFDVDDIVVDDVIVSGVVTTSRHSISLRGIMRDRQFELRGPYTVDTVELEIALPVSKTRFYVLSTRFDPAPASLLGEGPGGAPLVRGTGSELAVTWVPEPLFAAAGQCDDGYDNDPDGFADACDFSCVQHPDFGTDLYDHDILWEASKDIGFFGMMEYCTRHEDAYLAEFAGWGAEARQLLNWVQPRTVPENYDPTVRPPPFRVVMRGCLMASSIEVAEECDRSGTCPAMWSEYPGQGNGQKWGGILEGEPIDLLSLVWNVVDYTVTGGEVGDTHPIQMAVLFPFTQDFDAVNVVGKSVVKTGQSSMRWAGSSIAYWNAAGVFGSTSTTSATIAHERGHSMGLAHDNVYYPGTSIRGFMHQNGGIAPVLDWEQDSDYGNFANGEVYQGKLQDKFFPRPSGFKYKGCASNPSVCIGNGLQCNDGYCQ